MAKLNNNYLKLAIQKKGRLTEETMEFLQTAGFVFDSYKQQLFSSCRNFPMEILYVRDDDIPNYVASGTVDLGIVGQNIIYEEKPAVKNLLSLGFGYCSLIVAVPKESNIKDIRQLVGMTIATSYPESTKAFFKKNNIPVKIILISGSVEITPALGIAQAIVDIKGTGSTLALNDLRELTKIYESEAKLIANRQSFVNGKKDLLNKIITRFNGVLNARDYKYVMMNAPEKIIPQIKKIIPGLKSPTISPIATKEWVSIQTVIREEVFWDTIEKLKKVGASGIIVLPIEKIIL